MVNIFPFANELRKWMTQEPAVLPQITPESLYLTNPYSQSASNLVLIFAEIVNDFAGFAIYDRPNEAEAWRIDLRRMRLASEMILYATRICEALFKQMLFCTQFHPNRYEFKALGQMLSAWCQACKGRKKHKVSLAGSLAHRYMLCGQYEQCLREDLEFMNRLRNEQAAHASVGQLSLSPSVEEAWKQRYCQMLWIGVA